MNDNLIEKKLLVKTLALVVIVLFISVSFQPIIAIKSASDEEESDYNNVYFQQAKNYLFQTIVDMANNNDIQRIILKSQMSKGILSVSDIPMLTKNKLRHMYFIGLILSKFISKSRMQSMISEYQFNNQEILNEINTVIEKDSTISKEIKQLSNLKCCDCENEDTNLLWHFPIICTLLAPWYVVGWYLILWGLRWNSYFDQMIGMIIVKTLEKISSILHCWWPPSENHFPFVSDISPADGEENVSLNLTELRFRLTDPDGDLMSYKVWTNPPIGEGNNTLVPNGTYTVPIHGLINSTEYTWNIYLYMGDTSGTPFHKEYTFTTAPLAPFISNPTPKDNALYVPIFTSNVSFNLTDFQGDLMNWTVETQPNIGSGGANGVGDGRYTVAISGLEYEKEYTWFVNATDGTYWTNKTYVFTTTSEGLLVFEPIADTYVTDNDPDETRWMNSYIFLSKKDGSISSCWDMRGLVLFDLSDIPAGSMIISANLRLYYFGYGNINPVGREITCHRILEYWDEKTTTFNTMPDSDPMECASTFVPENYSWVGWNVTSEVDDFINGSVVNYGWMIRDYKDPLWQYSHSHYYQSNANNEYPPRLFVWFDNP